MRSIVLWIAFYECCDNEFVYLWYWFIEFILNILYFNPRLFLSTENTVTPLKSMRSGKNLKVKGLNKVPFNPKFNDPVDTKYNPNYRTVVVNT